MLPLHRIVSIRFTITGLTIFGTGAFHVRFGTGIAFRCGTKEMKFLYELPRQKAKAGSKNPTHSTRGFLRGFGPSQHSAGQNKQLTLKTITQPPYSKQATTFSFSGWHAWCLCRHSSSGRCHSKMCIFTGSFVTRREERCQSHLATL